MLAPAAALPRCALPDGKTFSSAAQHMAQRSRHRVPNVVSAARAAPNARIPDPLPP